MPELPEVETIIRGLRQKIVGQEIIGIGVNLLKIVRGKKKKFISLAEGARIQEIRRRGKIILIDLSNGMSLLIHLKLTGQLIYARPKEPMAKHTHLIFNLSNGRQLRYIDLRQFGYFLLAKTSQLSQLPQLKDLGPDPLKVSLDEFKKLLSKRRGRIKSLLLNQMFLAGIGNIYADEALHRAKIHPLQPAHTLSSSKVKRLHQAIREVLTEAIKQKGSSVSDYVDSSGQDGNYQKFHRVYQREGKPCLACQTKIARLKIGNRSSYFCPNCQSLPAKDKSQHRGRWF